jgi:hypothetical protein
MRHLNMLVVAIGVVALPALGACPPSGRDRASLEALKSADFAMTDDAERQSLAVALLDCVSNPDPFLRDAVAFEAYSTWLRANLLDQSTRTTMLARLLPMLEEAPDRDGFRQPFAALVLSELARTDRLAAWMTSEQRARLVDQAALYLMSVRDYRGFDAREGWRHGVAHGSDLITQLALNPRVDRAAADRLLAAVASQVSPVGEHAYVDGESERLARAVLFTAQRALHSAADWEQWLRAVAAPAPLPDWGAAFQSRAGLAKRHNLMSFLNALYVGARESGDENMQRLVPGLQAVYRTLR